jgi:Ricin-type beta-trefoil lectin domain-like
VRHRLVVAVVATVAGLLAGAVLVASPAQARFGNYYEIINAVTGKCADVADKSRDPGYVVHEWTCANDDNQLWLAQPVGNGYFEYINMRSGLCLDGGQFPIAATLVTQQVCDTSRPGQWWRWLGADDIGHLVLNSGLGNLCLALLPFSSRNGTLIEIDDCATTSGQMWHTD